MEITLKITENQPELLRALAKLMEQPEAADAPMPEAAADKQAPAPEPEAAADKQSPASEPEAVETPPWEDGVPAMETKADEMDAGKLRPRIRSLGGKLTAAGKAEQLMEVFKKHGSAKLSGLDDAVLPEVLAELEAL